MSVQVKRSLNKLLVFCHSKHIFKWLFYMSVFFLLSYCLHPARFAEYYYDYIDIEHIPNHLSCSPTFSKNYKSDDSKFCTIILDKNINSIVYPKTVVTESELTNKTKYLHIQPGGIWKPSSCVSKFQVAIIVPYRDRKMQLNVFLSYMHPFLQAQMLEYRIVVVQQTSLLPFNRAKLFNVGFMETLKIYPYHCFIFHDVDLIPQNMNNIYACTYQPRHMSSNVNTFRYNLPYKGLFGGVVAMLRYQFEDINGFSNAFFGWGGEDDDFRNRLSNKGLQICRFSPDVAKYVMLAHKKEPPSKTRFITLKAGKERYESDGLNNLDYSILKLENRSLYTWILVNIITSSSDSGP